VLKFVTKHNKYEGSSLLKNKLNFTFKYGDFTTKIILKCVVCLNMF